jgi:hypothetical protein
MASYLNYQRFRLVVSQEFLPVGSFSLSESNSITSTAILQNEKQSLPSIEFNWKFQKRENSLTTSLKALCIVGEKPALY